MVAGKPLKPLANQKPGNHMSDSRNPANGVGGSTAGKNTLDTNTMQRLSSGKGGAEKKVEGRKPRQRLLWAVSLCSLFTAVAIGLIAVELQLALAGSMDQSEGGLIAKLREVSRLWGGGVFFTTERKERKCVEGNCLNSGASKGTAASEESHKFGASDALRATGESGASQDDMIALDAGTFRIRIQLFPVHAPKAIQWVRQFLSLPTCASCALYRAEGGGVVAKEGDPSTQVILSNLIQGTFDSPELPYTPIPLESPLPVDRGSVGLVPGGPHFFLSLDAQPGWGTNTMPVFGRVVPEDLYLLDWLVTLPTKTDEWNGSTVFLLEHRIKFNVSRL